MLFRRMEQIAIMLKQGHDFVCLTPSVTDQWTNTETHFMALIDRTLLCAYLSFSISTHSSIGVNWCFNRNFIFPLFSLGNEENGGRVEWLNNSSSF
jgi:hypothetical protein